MNIQDLLRLKKEIESAKASLQQLKGERNYLMKELKETWQCDSMKEGEALIQKKQEEVAQIKATLSDLLETIQEKYDTRA